MKKRILVGYFFIVALAYSWQAPHPYFMPLDYFIENGFMTNSDSLWAPQQQTFLPAETQGDFFFRDFSFTEAGDHANLTAVQSADPHMYSFRLQKNPADSLAKFVLQFHEWEPAAWQNAWIESQMRFIYSQKYSRYWTQLDFSRQQKEHLSWEQKWNQDAIIWQIGDSLRTVELGWNEMHWRQDSVLATESHKKVLIVSQSAGLEALLSTDSSWVASTKFQQWEAKQWNQTVKNVRLGLQKSNQHWHINQTCTYWFEDYLQLHSQVTWQDSLRQLGGQYQDLVFPLRTMLGYRQLWNTDPNVYYRHGRNGRVAKLFGQFSLPLMYGDFTFRSEYQHYWKTHFYRLASQDWQFFPEAQTLSGLCSWEMAPNWRYSFSMQEKFQVCAQWHSELDDPLMKLRNQIEFIFPVSFRTQIGWNTVLEQHLIREQTFSWQSGLLIYAKPFTGYLHVVQADEQELEIWYGVNWNFAH